MKKNIGPVLGLYPTPLVVVGAVLQGKTNWTLVGHLGVMGHDRLMLSMAQAHHTNQGIKESKILSVNIVEEAMLKKADYVGCVSGRDVDKSGVFPHQLGDAGAPVIEESPLAMECSAVALYQTAGFDSFILSAENAYAEESVLTGSGKIDYRALKAVLFQMPTYEYLGTGDVIAGCMSLGRGKS